MTLWIKDPLAIFVDDDVDAGSRVAIENDVIVKLVPTGHKPKSAIARQVNAVNHVVVPGLIQWASSLFSNADAGIWPGPEQGIVPPA